MTHLLDNIRIVLVETTLPANIGSAARAMKTMGLLQLHVVNPKHPIDDDAIAHAAGAKDVLAAAKFHQNIEDALADCHIVWAASSRRRTMPQPTLSLRQVGNALTQLYQQAPNKVENDSKPYSTLPKIAVLFGREDRGLTNAELALANYHVYIPANENYGVLNLAAAVQVFGYEIRQALVQQPTKNIENQLQHNLLTEWDEPLATHGQILALEEKILATASLLGVYDENNPRKTPERIKRLLSRTQLDQKEHNILRALLKNIDAVAKNSAR